MWSGKATSQAKVLSGSAKVASVGEAKAYYKAKMLFGIAKIASSCKFLHNSFTRGKRYMAA